METLEVVGGDFDVCHFGHLPLMGIIKSLDARLRYLRQEAFTGFKMGRRVLRFCTRRIDRQAAS